MGLYPKRRNWENEFGNAKYNWMKISQKPIPVLRQNMMESQTGMMMVEME